MDVAVKTLGLRSALGEGRNANASLGTPASTLACDSHVFATLKFCFHIFCSIFSFFLFVNKTYSNFL